MKVAIIDRDKDDLKELAKGVYTHYGTFKRRGPVQIFRYVNDPMFIKCMCAGIDFEILYIEDSCLTPALLDAIGMLLPYCVIIILTSRKDYISAHNFEVLTKPYSRERILDTLAFFLKKHISSFYIYSYNKIV